jgi:hypothetical protein
MLAVEHALSLVFPVQIAIRVATRPMERRAAVLECEVNKPVSSLRYRETHKASIMMQKSSKRYFS